MKKLSHQPITSHANANHVATASNAARTTVATHPNIIQRAIGNGAVVNDRVVLKSNYETYTVTQVNGGEPLYKIKLDQQGGMEVEPVDVRSDDDAYELYKKSNRPRPENATMIGLMAKFMTAKSRLDHFAAHSAYRIQGGVNRFKDPDATDPYENSSSAPFSKDHYETFWHDHIQAIANQDISDKVESTGDGRIRTRTLAGWNNHTVWNDRTAVANKGRMLSVNSSRGQSYVLLSEADSTSNSEDYVIDTQDAAGKNPSQSLSTAFGKIQKGNSHADIMHLMKTLAAGGKVDDIDTAELNTLIQQTPYNQTWLASKFRFQGKHEWVPSNMVYNVIKKAEDDGQNASWIDLQDKLASDTGDLIFKPNKAKPEAEVDGTTNSLQGHSGAIYGQRAGKSNKPLTQGQANFHDELRQRFMAAATPKNCVDALKIVATNWIWNNEQAPFHNKHSRGGGNTGTTDTATLKAEQPAAYTRVMDKFDNVKAQL